MGLANEEKRVNISLVAFDFDDTLAPSKSRIDPENGPAGRIDPAGPGLHHLRRRVMRIRSALPVGLLFLALVGGCTQPNSVSTASTTVTVTVPTTVTEVKTIAQVQTQIIAPPVEVKTVSTVQTTTVSPSAVTVIRTVTAAKTAPNGNYLTFNSATVAADVRKILTDSPPTGYGILGVADVSCPNDQPVKVGATFLCHITINNASKSVKITVRDNEGRYQVGIPD